MNGFTVSTRLSLNDWKAYQAAYSRRAQLQGWRGAALMIGVPVLTGLLAYGALRFAHGALESNWLLLGALIGYGSLIIVGRITRFLMRPLGNATFLGECTFDFSPLGIRVRRSQHESMSSWTAVREITATADHLFIWIDSTAAFVVPLRDFPAGMTGTEALGILRDLQTQVGAVGDGSVPSTAAAGGLPVTRHRAPQWPRSTTRSMQAAIRWLSWRTFDPRALDAPDLAIALLAVLSVVLLIGLDRIGLGAKAQFNWFGAQVIACKTLGLLGIGWLIWRTSEPQASWRTVLFVLGTLTLVGVPVRWGIDHLHFGIWRLILPWALLVLQLVYLARALRLTTGYRQTRAVVLSLIALVVAGGLFSRYLDMGPIWYQAASEEYGQYTRSAHEAERLLMSQPARIEAAVASMAPRSGDTSMYMVGFAGVGEQKVFAGEIALAAKVIGDRYGTRQRTLLLVNDQRDLESRPLASVTGLKLALADIGKRMDRDRDVLMLVISSHGSQEPAISVSNGGVPLNELTGKDLKAALDEAGIRWRVVIISACHAGAFIPYLRDERSIVIAAASPDRSSFGCSNDRDLTDFGEAFLRDALPKASSIRSAFETAQASIAAREKAEHLTPSLPTAYFGTAIENKLQSTP